MSDDAKREFAAAFRNRGFVCVLAVMLTAALGLNTAQRAMKFHFQKERVELRRDLDRLPADFGPWTKVVDEQLSDEIVHTLGTKEYVQRTYVDTRKLTPAEVGQLKALSGTARLQRVSQLTQQKPSAVISLHIAYYTGLVDTVAHVPERCYVAGGSNVENTDVVALPAFARVPGRSPDLKFKYAEFRNRAAGAGDAVRNVAYCFQVNGKYEFDSIKGVRFRLQNIFEKYGYYAKIELATFLGSDAKQAQATMADFLSYAMPEIETCLPDWHAVTGEDAPLNAGQ